jgi:hypothetical protein
MVQLTCFQLMDQVRNTFGLVVGTGVLHMFIHFDEHNFECVVEHIDVLAGKEEWGR